MANQSDSAKEMEQIQRALEEFLNQEVEEMQEEGSRRKKQSRQTTQTAGNTVHRSNSRATEDEIEDWDAPMRQSRSGGSSRANTGRSAAMESTNRRTTGKENKKKAARTEPSRRNKKDTGRRKLENAEPQKGRQKKRKKKHTFRKILIALILIVALGAAGLYAFVGMVYNKLNYEEIESLVGAPMKEDGVVNILLIGNDSRENGEDGRSDAMILLSISSKTKKIYMTSLLRDMYVDIPGHDGNRLNAAYAFGGPELLMETIEKNLDITVNRYVLVNFEAFANLVDAVGGVDLELTADEVWYVNGYLVEYNILLGREEGTDYFDELTDGVKHLNGPQALAYCRNRYIGTDFGRTERQRKVLEAVIKKLPSALLTNAGDLIDGLMPNLTTNLTKDECFQLSLMAPKALYYDIEADSIPQSGTYSDARIRDMAVLEVDFDANAAYLKEKIYGEE